MGSIGGESAGGLQRSIAIAEEKYKGWWWRNDGPNFSAGANVAMIFMMAIEQDLMKLIWRSASSRIR